MPFDPKKYGAKEVKTQSGVDLSKYGATEVPEASQAPQPEKKKASFGALGDLLFRAAQVGAEAKKQKPLFQLERAYENKKTADANAPLAALNPEQYKAKVEAESKAAEDELRVQRNLLKPFLNEVAVSAEKSWKSFSDDGVPDYENIFKTAGELAQQFGGGDNAKEELANTIIQSVKSGAIREKADQKFKVKTGFDVNEYITRQQQKEGGLTEEDRRFVEDVYKSGVEEVVNEEQQTKEALSAAMPLLQKTGGAFLSALQSGIASKGTALATQYGISNKVTDWMRGFKTGAEKMDIPQKEWTMENIKSDPAGTIIPFVAQQAGASLPGMVSGVLTGLATGSGPAGAIVSLLDEKLANTGDTYEQLIAQGVPIDEAKRRSAELMKPMITDALSFVEMDLLLKAAKGRGSQVLNAIGSGITEVPAEYQQQYEQEKALNPELTVGEFLKKTGATLGVQTFVSSALMGGAIGGAGKVASVLANKVPNGVRQMLQSVVQKQGAEKAKEIIAAQAEDGVLTEGEIQDLQTQVDEIAQADQTLEQMGVPAEVRQAATALSTQINDINQRLLTEANPAVTSKLMQERQKLQTEMDGIISGEKGFVQVTTETGATYSVPEAQAQEVINDLKEEIENGTVEAEKVGQIKVEIPPKRKLPKAEGIAPKRKLPKAEGIEPAVPKVEAQPTVTEQKSGQVGGLVKSAGSEILKKAINDAKNIYGEKESKGVFRDREDDKALIKKRTNEKFDIYSKEALAKELGLPVTYFDDISFKEWAAINPANKNDYQEQVNILREKYKSDIDAYSRIQKADGATETEAAPQIAESQATEDVLTQPTAATPTATKPISQVTTEPTPKAKEGVAEEVQPSAVSVGQGKTEGTAAVLTPEQEAEMDAAMQPEIPLTMIPSTALSGKEITLEAKLKGTNKKVTWEGTDVQRHNEIKEEYKKLRQILDCIGKWK